MKYQLTALLASDPENKTSLMKQYEGLTKYSDKLTFALHRKLDKAGNFMTATETHSSAFARKTGFGGWLDGGFH